MKGDVRNRGAAAGLLLFFIAWGLCRREPTALDRSVLAWVEGWRSDVLDHLMVFLTFLNNPIGVFGLSLVVVAILVLLRDGRGALYYAVAVGGTGLLAAGLKAVFGRERPETGLLELGSYAFPSWHAAVSTALAVALLLIFQRFVTGARRRWLGLLFLWPLLIGFTRIYLHVHWFTDVLGGWGVGLFWASLAGWMLKERGDGDA